jgi:hypothetical protein
MSASSYDLCIPRNTDYDITIQLKAANGSPINLTGAFVYSEIKQDYYLPLIANLNATIIDQASGIVKLSMTAEQTSALHPGTLKYDVLVRYSNNIFQKVLQGNVEVETNITSLGIL